MNLNPPIVSHKPLDWSSIEKIAIQENQTPLVRLQKTICITPTPVYYDWQLDGAINAIYLRQTVAQRLSDAADLLPEGIGLMVLDG